MNYIITKRTECEYNDTACLSGRCARCVGGISEVKVDADEWLLSRLAKLRWNPRFTDNGTEWDEFDGMEIVNG